MNDNPAPLTADQVDDLLSAELDGELAAAAADLGLDLADARPRSTPRPASPNGARSSRRRVPRSPTFPSSTR
jgi:hypothetical protein